MSHIVLVGDAITGILPVGVFPDADQAELWVNRVLYSEDHFVIVPLIDPGEYRTEEDDHEALVEKIASELALLDGYDPNAFPPEQWGQIAQRFTQKAQRILEVIDELDESNS